MQITVITANGNDSNSYTVEWLRSFQEYEGIRVKSVDLLQPGSTHRLAKSLSESEACVSLHTTLADAKRPFARAIPILQNRSIPFLSFVGNEFNSPLFPLSTKIEMLGQVSPEVVATQLLPEAGEFLYGSLLNTKIISIPHAANPDTFWLKHPKSQAKLRIGTRSVTYPSFLGDQDRSNFIRLIKETLNGELWESDFDGPRFATEGWRDFLASLDVAVGTEAGSFFTVPNDDTVLEIYEWAKSQQGQRVLRIDSNWRSIIYLFPWRFRSWVRSRIQAFGIVDDLSLLELVNAEEVLTRFFREPPPRRPYTKAISSRHMEAASVGTPQILMEGRYNDILIPWKHFVPVKRDLSDLNEALELLQDSGLRRTISGEARNLIVESHTIKHRVELVVSELAELA